MEIRYIFDLHFFPLPLLIRRRFFYSFFFSFNLQIADLKKIGSEHELHEADFNSHKDLIFSSFSLFGGQVVEYLTGTSTAGADRIPFGILRSSRSPVP